MPLTNVVGLDLTRTETLDVALAQSATSDIAAITDCQIEFADVLGGVIAPPPTLGRAARQIATKDHAVVTAVTTAVLCIRALKPAVVTADRSAAVTRTGALKIAAVALTVDDALVEAFAAAVVTSTIPAASNGEQSKPK